MYREYLKPLTQILSYPEKEMKTNVEKILEISESDCTYVHEALKKFMAGIETEELQKLREIYTTTFDLKAMACMDVGYVLFGEDYKRGAFLVEIQRLMKENGIEPGTELPDHLPNMLKLIEVMPENEEKRELMEKIILPALERILSNFERNQGNFYEYPLQALRVLSEREYNMDDTVLKGAY